MDGQSSSWPCAQCHNSTTLMVKGSSLPPSHCPPSSSTPVIHWASSLPYKEMTRCTLHVINNLNNGKKKKKRGAALMDRTTALRWRSSRVRCNLHPNLSAFSYGQTGLLIGQMVGTTMSALKRSEVMGLCPAGPCCNLS